VSENTSWSSLRDHFHQIDMLRLVTNVISEVGGLWYGVRYLSDEDAMVIKLGLDDVLVE
jgi:hypothetical protein